MELSSQYACGVQVANWRCHQHASQGPSWRQLLTASAHQQIKHCPAGNPSTSVSIAVGTQDAKGADCCICDCCMLDLAEPPAVLAIRLTVMQPCLTHKPSKLKLPTLQPNQLMPRRTAGLPVPSWINKPPLASFRAGGTCSQSASQHHSRDMTSLAAYYYRYSVGCQLLVFHATAATPAPAAARA